MFWVLGSPGNPPVSRGLLSDILRASESTKEFKQKRRARREQRSSKGKQLETREGPHYETGLGYRSEHLVEEIPPPSNPPNAMMIYLPNIYTKLVLTWRHHQEVV